MSNKSDVYSVIIYEDVIWGQMDAFAHVNNTVYFRYFENVRIAYFKKSGILEHFQQTQTGPILASTSCDYRAPLTYPDNIQIATRVTEIKSNRFKMAYRVFSEKLKCVAAEGQGLVVFYDFKNAHSCDIPESIVSNIKRIESATTND